MSVASLTTIAAARAEASTPARKPKKAEVGGVPRDHSKADDDAGIKDVLARQIPTELVVPYTAITAAIVGLVAKPTTKNPRPDELVGWRWAAFVLLIASVVVMVWVGKALKSGSWGFPFVTVSAGGLSATAWAFLMPGSPLEPYLDSRTSKALVPLFVAFVGVVVAAVTAALLTTDPKKSGGA
jgi:hypothetical protein